MNLIVFVEGNIGCGKSTLLHHLSEASATVVPEPVAGWCEHLRGAYGCDGADTAAAWRFPMQMLSVCTRNERLFAAIRGAQTSDGDGTPRVVFVERSDRSAAIFSALTLERGAETDAFELLVDRYARAARDSWKGGRWREATVYLRASAATCARRVATRARDGESGVDDAYLSALHDAHESVFGRTAECIVQCDTATSDEIAATVLRWVESVRTTRA